MTEQTKAVETVTAHVDTAAIKAIQQDGFAVVPSVYPASQLAAIEEALRPAIDASTHRRTDTYAARNLIRSTPALSGLWRTELMEDMIQRVLGAEAGLVGIS